MKKMKIYQQRPGKAMRPNEIPAEIWKYLGQGVVVILCKLLNVIPRGKRMPSEWRMSILIPIYKGKGGTLGSLTTEE